MAACSSWPSLTLTHIRRIYLVTEGDLRMTESRMLDKGGISSTESGVITSSGWVILKESEHSNINHLLNRSKSLKNLINQVT